MASAGFVLDDATINWMRGVPDTEPGSLELRLWTVAPAKDGTGGTEVVGGGYAPEVITLTAPVDGATEMTADATFANWPAATIATHYSIHNGDNDDLLIVEEFLTPQTTTTGLTLTISAADLTGKVA